LLIPPDVSTNSATGIRNTLRINQRKNNLFEKIKEGCPFWMAFFLLKTEE